MKFNSLGLEEKRKREISLQSQQKKGVLTPGVAEWEGILQGVPWLGTNTCTQVLGLQTPEQGGSSSDKCFQLLGCLD